MWSCSGASLPTESRPFAALTRMSLHTSAPPSPSVCRLWKTSFLHSATARMCRRPVWSMFPLIRRSSVFWCVSAENHLSLAIHWPFSPASPPIRQNGFSLIVHGFLLHPVCYIDSSPFSFSFPLRLVFRYLPRCCALIYAGAFLLTRGGASLRSFSFMPSLSLILLLCLSCSFYLRCPHLLCL